MDIEAMLSGRHDVRDVRVSVSGWSTTEDDIDRSVAAVRACASA